MAELALIGCLASLAENGLVMYPVVNRDTCTGCGNCVEICPSEVYRMDCDKSYPLHPEECIECWACAEQCPTGSIQLRDG